MKKIYMAIMFLIMMVPTYAYTICAKSGTYVGILRKNVNGIVGNVTNTATKKQWAVDYDYKTITGYAACNDVSGTVNGVKTNLSTNALDVGSYCWCEMWPIYDEDDSTTYHYETGISSYWVLLKQYTGDNATDDCASGCAQSCADAMANNTGGFRSAVFESVW